VNSTQEEVYAHAPGGGGLGWDAITFMAAMLAVAIFLLYTQSYAWTVVFVALFFSVNIAGWRYIVTRVVKPMFEASKARYIAEEDGVGSEKLAVVIICIAGTWHYWHFLAGTLLIVYMSAVAISRA
jgi:hypothetical protein